jgi:hypothetical protein
MFTYIDPTVRERLVAAGKLILINRDGERLAPDQSGGGSISILGPIPLPLAFGDSRYCRETAGAAGTGVLCEPGFFDGGQQRVDHRRS